METNGRGVVEYKYTKPLIQRIEEELIPIENQEETFEEFFDEVSGDTLFVHGGLRDIEPEQYYQIMESFYANRENFVEVAGKLYWRKDVEKILDKASKI